MRIRTKRDALAFAGTSLFFFSGSEQTGTERYFTLTSPMSCTVRLMREGS